MGRALEPYAELASYVGQLQGLAQAYLRLLDLFRRFGAVSPDLVLPDLKDDISRHIVSVLIDRPDRNISEITGAVKRRRGTASRRIVRERLEGLERQGIVVRTAGAREQTFRVADAVVAKWSQVLGFPKYGDRTSSLVPKGGDTHAKGMER